MTTALPDIDLRELSEAHSERPEFVSLYLNTPEGNIDRTFIENREREIRKALAHHPGLKAGFRRTMETLVEEISRKGAGGEAIVAFACGPQDFLWYHELPLPVENLLVLDSSPYIKPLAFLYEEYEHFLIVMVDHNNGVIHSVVGKIKDTSSIHKDIFHHHRKGGWSQMRYQRIREGNILHLFKEIAEKTAEIDREENVKRIVLAGPKDAKKKFYQQLPEDLKKKVIGYANMDMGASQEEMLDGVYRIFFEEEQKEETKRMERLRSEIFKGGLAAVGPVDTIKALREGRVFILLLDPGTDGGGWKCEKCGIWGTGAKEICPDCGRPIFQVDVFEEAVEEAQKMDSEVEFVKDDEFLQAIGGMAAVLRW